MTNKPVIHITDGRSSWKIGVVGMLVRIKGIAGTAMITIISMGAPWWWPEHFPTSIYLDVKKSFILSVIFLGGGLTFALWYLRKRTTRSLDVKYQLHQLLHGIRDKQTELHEKLSPNRKYSKGKLNKELETLLSQICERSGAYFRLLTSDETIGVAIRLASLGDDNSVVYKTFARSNNLNSHRKKTSESIPITKGIPRFLREDKNAQGVLIYYDLAAAADAGAYILTENDRKYPDDIATMMVAPLNAWSGVQQDMIGIMYITSRDKDAFKAIHVDSLAFLADLTASAVANTMELVRLKCSNPELIKGGEYAKII